MTLRGGRVAVVAMLVIIACSRGPELLPVTLPDLAGMDAPVQAQARDRYAAVTAKRNAGAADEELGRAFGELGMLLDAAEYYDAAAPAYLNAQRLMPAEPRWPYFLGHLHRSRGDHAQSIAAFARVLELQPGDLATRIWLARGYLAQGQADRAEPLLLEAQKSAPQTVAVLAALGQVALARRDYPRAVALFEDVLRIDPTAQSVHSPLAQAHRMLGDAARAEAHLKQWRNTDILVPDPWRQELQLTLESGLSYEVRGVRALDSKDFRTAADMFRQGLTLTPETTLLGRSLRHKLGTALFLAGDVRGAMEQFENTVRLAPAEGSDEPSAKAHYSLAVLAFSSGQTGRAIAHFTDAIRYNSGYVEAHAGLADAQRRAGQWEAALPHYRETVRLNPRRADARLGYALALVRLRRYAEARAWLDEAVQAQPDRPELAQALARVLAASPDSRARDGARALTNVQELFKSDKTTTLGETMAMALAETGDFRTAVGVQRGILAAESKAGLTTVVSRMKANLALYERSQPCRQPWADDDPVHAPGPPVSEQLAALTK